jgi:dihydropteroate synthase
MAQATLIHCGTSTLDLRAPVVMGVLNVTPDSFSDGGRYFNHEAAIARAAQMVKEGAGIIDVGGESTRPGASEVSIEEELRRVVPVIEAIATHHDVLISIDTSKPEVMAAAVAAGAELINDIRALTLPGALQVAATTKAAVCLMHMQATPQTMQQNPHYEDVLKEVKDFLLERVRACEQAGIARERLLLDPGIGFGKTTAHNLTLMAHLPYFHDLKLPLLIGVSRKRLLAEVLGRAVDERVSGGVALATAAVLAGARIIRAHDVAATVDGVRMAHALQQAGYRAE